MSMDDPGWGEAVPEGAAPAPTAPVRPTGNQLTEFAQSNRYLLIGVGVGIVLIIVVIAVVVTSGGNKSSTSTLTPATTATTLPPTTTTAVGGSLSDAAGAYLAMETPAYNSLTALGSVVSGWSTTAPSPAEAQQAANPTVDAFRVFGTALLARTWPPAVKPQINALASQVEIVANDLGNLELTFSQGTQSAWGTQFTADATALVNDANAARSTLGLPALPTG